MGTGSLSRLLLAELGMVGQRVGTKGQVFCPGNYWIFDLLWPGSFLFRSPDVAETTEVDCYPAVFMFMEYSGAEQ